MNDTTQVSVLNNNYGGANHNLSYTYDANGNILTVSDGTNITTYTYDSLNQLLSEKNQAAGKSWVYTYDTGGNITSKTEYANATASGTGTTTAYGYTDANWGDLLKTYGGKALTYDNSGNLKTYNGWTYTWQDGRQLKSLTNGSTTLNFAYNDAGLRTSKNDHRYYYQGDLLTADVTSTDALYFHYDANGSILGFTYVSGSTSVEYYYVKNLQGDVIGIIDASGNQVASYTYNVWGQLLSVGGSNTTLANRNPIRYRGYYYDTECGLYYLQSRYYSPELCRFICPDKYTQTYEGAIGANMFAYCGNNPGTNSDAGGTFWTIAAGAVIGAAISAGVELASQIASGNKVDLGKIAITAVGGALGGALASTSFGIVGQVVGNAVIGAFSETASQLYSGNRNVADIAKNVGKTALVSAASVLVGGKGIRAKGSAYRQSIDTLNGLRDDVGRAVSNASAYKNEITSAISAHQKATRNAVRETTLRFGGATLFAKLFS